MNRTRNKLYLILSVACLAGYAWLYYHYTSTTSASAGVEVCFIKNATSIPCPSCGTTRALTALLHGQYIESLYLNPFGALMAIALVVLPVWILIDLALRKSTLHSCYQTMERVVKKPQVALPLVLLVAINWIWNITKGL